MKKHAYIITSNSNLSVLEKCLELIDDVRNDIYLLFDKKAKISKEYRNKLFTLLKYSNLYILPDIIINWAGYSQISAVINLLKSVCESGVDYQYIHFFQGSDLPIKSQNHIHEYCMRNYGYEFVMVEKDRCEMAKNKARYRHFLCHNRFFRTNKFIKILNFGFVLLQKIFNIQKNKDIKLYQGSALFSITLNCAKYLVSMEKEIHKRFRFSLAGDEVFIQTMLMKSNFKIKDMDMDSSSNLRLIDRTRPERKNSPHVWRSDEYSYLISLPENMLFSRKFDENIDFDVVEKVYNNLKALEYF